MPKPFPTTSSTDAFLIALERRLISEIERTPMAWPACSLVAAGGKRLRARLLWWSASATSLVAPDPADERLVRAAAAIELAHLASLIHDDIVDGGTTRRGVATLHHSHGLRLATDAGVAIAHLANALLAPLGSSARNTVRRALLATCRGQVRELAIPFVPVTPLVRLKIMQEKTGAFFELATALGAIVAGAPAKARAAVCRFARRFGVAFQIADDVLDLAGSPSELGRANGADLRDGVLTLPVLLALDREPTVADALTRIRRTPDAKNIEEGATIVARTGGIEAAATAANAWLDRALLALAPLGSSEAVAELTMLAHIAIARGIKPGTPRFAITPASRHCTGMPLFVSTSEFTADAQLEFGSRLARMLNWFHPGLAAMIAARTREPAVRRHRERFHAKPFPSTASSHIDTAFDAVGLAHAIADIQALETEPVQTLAMVDALHCAAMALVNQASDPAAQEQLSAYARHDIDPFGPVAPVWQRLPGPHLEPSVAPFA